MDLGKKDFIARETGWSTRGPATQTIELLIYPAGFFPNAKNHLMSPLFYQKGSF